MKKEAGKKGQVTIFIIVALAIIIFAILIYLFYPKMQSVFTPSYKNPFEKMKDCVEPTIEESLEKISKRGGSMNPELYYEYNDERIAYLCYTVEDYKTCVMQKPILINSVQEEIKKEVMKVSDECLDRLTEAYRKEGYKVELKRGEMEIEFVPENILVKYNDILSLTKTEKEIYEGFDLRFESKIYDLLMVATSILEFEVYYGDSEITTFMDYYRDLKVEKKRQTDGTKVYMLENTKSGEEFDFATRSLAWPAGY